MRRSRPRSRTSTRSRGTQAFPRNAAAEKRRPGDRRARESATRWAAAPASATQLDSERAFLHRPEGGSVRLGGALAERRDLAPLCQPLQGARLDLPHTFARQAQLSPDLLERLGIGITVHPVAQLDDLALTLRQCLDGAADSVLREADVHFLGRLGVLAGDEVAEARVALRTYRPVEARHSAGCRADLLHVLERELRLLGDLLVRRIPLELGHQCPLRA